MPTKEQIKKVREQVPKIVELYEKGNRPILVTEEEYIKYWDYLSYNKWHGKNFPITLWDTEVSIKENGNKTN